MIQEIIAFDKAAVCAVSQIYNPLLDAAMLGITLLGNPVFWLFVVAFFYWKGKENQSFHLMNIIVLSSIFVGALKGFFARTRPDIGMPKMLEFDTFGTHSFPSGHATLITAQTAYAKNKVPKKSWGIAAIVIALVAISRVYLGVHYPSDVIVGIIMGGAIGIAYSHIAKRVTYTQLHLTKSEDAIAIVAIITGAIFLVGFLQSIPLGAALIGYYLGFFSLKEIGLHEKKLTKKKYWIKQVIGFGVLIAIIALAITFPIANILIFGLAGYWVSCLWPIIFERIWQHD
ncbi:MAG: phosphatase PAP2 family protein [Candidatus Diapherotrites archaeon]|nr:phosphatase PAP2 family protein [Candidatus Diapherotrites archaeon]